MKRLLRSVMSIATGTAVLCLAGCADGDLTLAGHDLGYIIEEHVNSVKINPDDVARLWHLGSAGAVRDAASSFAHSPIWESIKKELDQAGDAKYGPVRDALIEAACDSVRDGKYSYRAYQNNLEYELDKSILTSNQPVTYQLQNTVRELSTTLHNDAKKGASTKATVAIGCTAYATHSLFSGS